MKSLSKEQWIAIIVVLVAATVLFYGFNKNIFGINNSKINQVTNMQEQLRKEVIVEGSGEIAEVGDKITVHYNGMFAEGAKFDSSYDRGQPFSIMLGQGQVIQGWDKGLVGVRTGEKLKLFVPGSFGYGEGGIPDGRGGYIIPPNSTLIFEIEVLKIEKAK